MQADATSKGLAVAATQRAGPHRHAGVSAQSAGHPLRKLAYSASKRAGSGETVFQSAGCAKCHQTVDALAAERPRQNAHRNRGRDVEPRTSHGERPELPQSRLLPVRCATWSAPSGRRSSSRMRAAPAPAAASLRAKTAPSATTTPRAVRPSCPLSRQRFYRSHDGFRAVAPWTAHARSNENQGPRVAALRRLADGRPDRLPELR